MTATDAPSGGPVKLPRCPACHARLLPNPDGAGLWCQFCGMVRDDGEARALSEQASASGLSAASDYDPPGRDPFMSTELRRALDQAWDCIQAGDRVTAAYVLHEAQRLFPESADIWYLLSLTTDDRGEQFGYLTAALEAQPYHEYAWRDKGILEGVIAPGGAPERDEPAGPVGRGRRAARVRRAPTIKTPPPARTAASGPTRLPAARSGLIRSRAQCSSGGSLHPRVADRRACAGPNCAAQLTLPGAVLDGMPVLRRRARWWRRRVV